jgi:hypothetical protein
MDRTAGSCLLCSNPAASQGFEMRIWNAIPWGDFAFILMVAIAVTCLFTSDATLRGWLGL